jgi:RNA polymerase sigma factor (sigma-70 family)
MPRPPDDLPPPPDVPSDEPGPRSPDDRQLLLSILAGDTEALRRLIGRYDRLVRYTVYRAGKRYCDRDPTWLDARANDAWAAIVQAVRRLGARNLPSNPATYFAQIARNKALDAIRAADSRDVIPFEEAHGKAAEQVADPTDDPALLLENLDELEALRDCLARLSEDEQVICAEIALIMEKRWAEAAGRLNLPESTLRSRWRAILGRLKACLEKKSKKK